MEKVLVCLNDGLVKIRINRLLSEKNISFTITENPISRNELVNYSVLIIHSSYHLNDLFGFLENVLIQKLITVLYITANVNSNPFRRFTSHSHLIFVDETKMDVELPYAIDLHSKYAKQIEDLTEKNVKLTKKIDETENYNRCKRKLMNDGMTEDEAHKYILKYAMDNNIDKNEACKRLQSQTGQ